MGIYKSVTGKQKSLELYDFQMDRLGITYSDIYIMTSFGQTHIIETGNDRGKDLVIFHGGNSTTAYNLLLCDFLLKDFHIYAVDIIGHPGKSAEKCLSHKNYDYGIWAAEVIDGLGLEKVCCFGGSFGGGVLAKLLCVAPEKIEKAVLAVPAGINNALPISTVGMIIPLVMYRITKKEKYIKRTAMHMALFEEVLDEDTLAVLKDSFDNVKTKIGMPSNVNPKLLKNYKSPTLVIAAERDCLFPAGRVLPKAQKIFCNCETLMMEGSGHMHVMPVSVKNKIIEFLNTK